MTPQFGFSLGDLIRGIELLIESIQSLNETKGARAEYRKFTHELSGLKRALQYIENSCPDITDPALSSATENAVSECKECIEDFMKCNNQFTILESVSHAPWTLSGLRIRGKMVQWALCKKADIAKFRGEIHRQIENVQMLQLTVIG